MNKIAVTRTALVLGLGALAAAAAGAQGLVNARVLSAAPVWQQVPVSDCGPNPGAVRPGGAGTALGALVGGLLGSQVGSGNGRIAGAMLGTVGGALLGNAAETQGGYHGCGTRYEQRVTGYDVHYDLGGRQYRTRTAQAPGAWIQVPAPDGYGQADPAYGAQGYPVAPAPVAGYPLPPAYPAAGEASGVVTAPPVAYDGGAYPYPAPSYPQPYPAAYPQPYPAPVYGPPPGYAYPAAPVYVRPAPVYVAPVGVNLSIGGVIGGGHHHRRRGGGWGVGIGF